MAAYRSAPADRIRAGVPVVLVHVLLAYGLLRGLDYAPPVEPEDLLRLTELTPEQVPPPVQEPPPPPPPSTGSAAPNRPAEPRPEGAASPPNLEARPTPLVAPEPIVPPLRPPPIPAAPIAGTGRAASAGAAPIPGPGTGSGGFGTGTGSGRYGGGPGGGGGGGGDGDGWGLRPPRLIRGRISIRDFPPELEEYGVGGTVSVRYVVETSGRVTNCTVTRSSGSRLLDQTTCRLIEQRFMFDPSRDRFGRPIRSNIVEDHHWEVEDLPPAPRRMPGRGW